MFRGLFLLREGGFPRTRNLESFPRTKRPLLDEGTNRASAHGRGNESSVSSLQTGSTKLERR
jgi:hypothetical protein